MTPGEFSETLEKLELTPSAFAKLVGVDGANMRKAAQPGSNGPGAHASFALRLMLTLNQIAEVSDGYVGEIASNALRGEFE